MAITTTKVIKLVFTTAGDKTFALSITDPKENLSKDDIVAVMNTIIEKNIFLSSSGALTGIQDIRIVNTTTNDLFDPPQA
ncbi:DUF2922 domain-containing protein [Desulfosporosinus sp. PR]|uniref:DUF2922 domain-containing protein n=1 Tax=Candidatus Desulfosporosinus nitrosoreducens TaxID=3401928 RepID=UPI0027E921CD|nr:DUF2922 domain-containing protein [Desulfosporosinus sp. PR]MDQ7094295.1 DUF2922 domain-containing protein [Desulfosporosinus sp. PR]